MDLIAFAVNHTNVPQVTMTTDSSRAPRKYYTPIHFIRTSQRRTLNIDKVYDRDVPPALMAAKNVIKIVYSYSFWFSSFWSFSVCPIVPHCFRYKSSLNRPHRKFAGRASGYIAMAVSTFRWAIDPFSGSLNAFFKF